MKKTFLKVYLEHGLSMIGAVLAAMSVVLLITDGISDERGFFGVALSIVVILSDIGRSAWVVRIRGKAFVDGNYEKLPCFDEMCSIFWVWDLNKFVSRNYLGANLFNCLKEK